MSARAIVSRRFIPPDRSSILDFALSSSWANARSSSARRRTSARGRPKYRAVDDEVLPGAELGVEVVELRGRRRAARGSPAHGGRDRKPRISSSPSVRSETDPSIRIVVDFPAPFGPSRPKGLRRARPRTRCRRPATRSPLSLRQSDGTDDGRLRRSTAAPDERTRDPGRSAEPVARPGRGPSPAVPGDHTARTGGRSDHGPFRSSHRRERPSRSIPRSPPLSSLGIAACSPSPSASVCSAPSPSSPSRCSSSRSSAASRPAPTTAGSWGIVVVLLVVLRAARRPHALPAPADRHLRRAHRATAARHADAPAPDPGVSTRVAPATSSPGSERTRRCSTR